MQTGAKRRSLAKGGITTVFVGLLGAECILKGSKDGNRSAISQNDAPAPVASAIFCQGAHRKRNTSSRDAYLEKQPNDRTERGKLGCSNTMEGETEKGDRLVFVASFVIRNGQRKRHRESRHVWAGKGGRRTLATCGMLAAHRKILR